MESGLRKTIVSVGMLSFALLGLAREARAIPVDNSVDIVWQNIRYQVEPATVTGGNFTATSDILDDILISILIGSPNDLQGFELVLSVGSSLSEIENTTSPFQLSYAAGVDRIGGEFPYPADLYEPSGSPYQVTLHLNQFQNYADLLILMQNGVPLAFSLDGSFFGDINAGAGLPSCIPGQQCPTWPGSVSVTVSGGGPTSVPEPSSFALLLVGGAFVAGVYRRRR